MKNKDKNEVELVRLAKMGDTVALNELFKDSYVFVYSLARRITGSVHDAEDVVQETFRKALLAFRKFRGDSKFSTWIYKIALNEAFAYKKKEYGRGRNTIYVDGCIGYENDVVTMDIADYGSDPQVIYYNKYNSDAIDDIISLLSKNDRTVLDMCTNGYSTREMSDIEGVSFPAVKSRLFRARLKVKKLLKEKTKK
jgi:RNA polymerase sigma-70 factor (ECF subfamily)